MTKRILSFVVVLAMLVSVLPASIVSAEAAATVHTHTDAHKCSEKCTSSEVAWTEWTSETTLPDKSGHYYLTKEVTLTGGAHTIPTTADVTICLNGFDIKAKEGARHLNVKGDLTISDCTAFTDEEGNYIAGAITGASCTDVGGAINIFRNGGQLVLEGGKITGNQSTSKGGAIYMQGGTSAGNGGAFYMYGGEISDNTAATLGGGIYADGANNNYAHPQVHIYGGTFRGNKALSVKTGEGCGGAICLWGKNQVTIQNAVIEGNTSSHGAVYAQTACTVNMTNVTITGNKANNNKTETGVYIAGGTTTLTVSGKTVISGNAGGKDLVFNNKSNPGLKVNGLTDGSSIKVVPHADATSFVAIADGGKQESWNPNWVTVNDEQVSLVSGELKVGHYHGTTKYEAWTGGTSHNTLPTGSKSYYLANDIIRNTNGGTIEIAAGATQHMCLNGYTITHRNPAGRLYNIKGTFFLEDCSAYTDSQGNYVSGGITYGGATPSTRTFGALFSVQRGSVMTMTGGQIYGLNSSAARSQDGVAVYVQGAQTGSKAVFNMQGGQIHSNTSKADGAAIRLTKASSNAATENFSEVNISGGKIWGNTSTTNGGAIAMTGDVLNITGGTITGNTAATGAVYVTAGVDFSISGSPVIAENEGGNLYLAGQAMISLGALDAGAKIGVGAASVGRAITNAQASDVTSHFVSDSSEVKISFKNSCVYLGSTHEHGIDGGAGDMGWTAWTSTTSLPNESGNFYLVNDVQLTGAVTLNANIQLNLCLNGRTVTAKEGARVMGISAGSTLTVTDCNSSCGTIVGGTHNYGGAFNVLRGGTLNLYNGKITGCTGNEEGGAVYIQSEKDGLPGAIFNMYGGELSGNTAKRGGAVTLAGTGAQFNMQGGTITGNEATNGGAVYIYSGATADLSGGTITGNTAASAAGGLYVNQGAEAVNLSGSIVIKDNTLSQQANNVYLLGDAKLTVKDLTQDASIMVSAATADRAITTAMDQAFTANMGSDSAYRMLTYKDGALYLEISDEHVHCVCFSKTQGCDHKETKWQAWESTTSLPTTSGNYYLLSDVKLAARATIPAGQDVKLCLNGKTVTAPENNRLILIQANAKLSITDCVGSGTLTGGNCTFGGAININRRATFNLYAGSITGNKSETAEGLGGAVYIQAGKTNEAGGIFNMYGGKLSGNTAYAGGGIYAAAGTEANATPAQINIHGGTISGNSAPGMETVNAEGKTTLKGGNGGAFYAGKYSRVTMTGGTVTGNYGIAYGGNIYLNGATGKFSGGKITKNVSEKDGGGLYAVSASTVEISGDIVISDNQVPSGAGGGIGFSGKSQVTMSGGTVSGNYAVQGGGAIVQSGASMILTGGTFSGNESKAYAGAIYVNQPNADGTLSTLTMSGGTITGNKSGNAAGGIYVNKGYMEMTGGTISKNQTANYGCGIYFMRSEGKVTGGTITGNVSGKDGAGLYAYAGKVEIGGDVKVTGNTSQKGAGGGLGFTKECQAKLTGGTITGNDAGNAGGIIVQGQAHLTMTGGYVGYNTTRASGGGVYVNKSSMDFYGGTITGNTSVKTGAGLFANDSTTRFAGTVFTKNEATANGGAMYINKGKATFNGGTYSDNSSLRYGGGIYMNAAEVTMNAAKITGNYAKVGSGGMHAYGGKLTLEKDVLVAENTTDSAGGGICVTKFCQLIINGSVFEKNEANNGGGVLIQNWASATLNDAIIRENVSYDGSGLYVFSNVVVYMNGGQVTGNISKTRLNNSGQTVGGNAAGVYVHTSTRTQSGQSTLYLNGVEISNNVAERVGGGVYLDMQMILHMDGCTVQNNQAGGYGAGIYQASGTTLTVKDTKILANSGTATGSALYAGSDFVLDGCTITGNKTTDGTAVYVAPARYDGHSYTNAVIKLGGDMQICDNEGTMAGDLYFDEGVAAAGTAEGFGKNTKILIQLHSGVLTNAILAAYDYEGGDQLYTITYGDRSMTEPEYVPVAVDTTAEPEDTVNVLLYMAVGLFVVAAAVVVWLLLKKKKAGNTAGEVNKN